MKVVNSVNYRAAIQRNKKFHKYSFLRASNATGSQLPA